MCVFAWTKRAERQQLRGNFKKKKEEEASETLQKGEFSFFTPPQPFRVSLVSLLAACLLAEEQQPSEVERLR